MHERTEYLLNFMKERHPRGVCRTTCVGGGAGMANLRALERMGLVKEAEDAHGIWYLTDKALPMTDGDTP